MKTNLWNIQNRILVLFEDMIQLKNLTTELKMRVALNDGFEKKLQSKYGHTIDDQRQFPWCWSIKQTMR